jgi:pimeloyl-ACP methyl ester carboxylesterase
MPAAVSHFVTAQDGLELHVRAYGARSDSRLPVICLPGLARTGADFERLARALSDTPANARSVFAVDSRGRGRSDRDPDPANYNVGVELNDVLTVMATLAIGPAVFVGTSRGGILTMLLASVRPDLLAGAVLNDIGPVIEPQGLLRIKGYVGKLPAPASFEDAAGMLRRLFGAQFTALTADDWTDFAHRTFEERTGKLVASYDPALAQALADFEIGQPSSPLWPQFDALACVPLMVVRGENSDLLSRDTVKAMRARRPDLQLVEVPAQGHAPLLMEDDIIAQIAEFIVRCDRLPRQQLQDRQVTRP